MNPLQEAVHCLNSRKAPANQKLDDMRGSDDVEKWHVYFHIFLARGIRKIKWVSQHNWTLHFAPLEKVCERIRINSVPVCDDVFRECFFEV